MYACVWVFVLIYSIFFFFCIKILYWVLYGLVFTHVAIYSSFTENRLPSYSEAYCLRCLSCMTNRSRWFIYTVSWEEKEFSKNRQPNQIDMQYCTTLKQLERTHACKQIWLQIHRQTPVNQRKNRMHTPQPWHSVQIFFPKILGNLFFIRGHPDMRVSFIVFWTSSTKMSGGVRVRWFPATEQSREDHEGAGFFCMGSKWRVWTGETRATSLTHDVKNAWLWPHVKCTPL